jgi:hypothetical protein
MTNYTTMPVKRDVKERLFRYGEMGDTYSDVLVKLMDIADGLKLSSERDQE